LRGGGIFPTKREGGKKRKLFQISKEEKGGGLKLNLKNREKKRKSLTKGGRGKGRKLVFSYGENFTS